MKEKAILVALGIAFFAGTRDWPRTRLGGPFLMRYERLLLLGMALGSFVATVSAWIFA